MKNKAIKGVLFSGVLLLSLVGATAFASSSVQKGIDENYSSPDFWIGSSLTEDMRKEVLTTLDYNEAKDKENLHEVTSEGYSKTMNEPMVADRVLYSSVRIEKVSDKKPLEVKIETGDPNVKPQDVITRVTEDMYRNAALTAGIEHAKITVTAPKNNPVSGESALSGVYLSMQEKGIELDEQRTELGNAEINMLTKIDEENKDNKEYDTDMLNAVMLDIKTEIAKLKEDQVTDESIQKIVETALKTYGLNGVVSPSQVTLLINYSTDLSNTFINSDKSETKDFINSVSNVKDDLVSSSKDKFKDIKMPDMGEVTEKSKNFFQKIWESITNFFSGDKDKEETN